MDGVCPTPGPRLATSPRSRLAMSAGRHRPPPLMRSEAPSSSDASGAGGRAGVAAPAPLPAPSGGGAGAGGGGRVGRARASPAPEPSLGLASHVNLERLVSGLLQHCKRGGVLVTADGGNPAVVGPEVRSGRKEGRDVGNKLPREGPCRWLLWGGWRCGN